MGENEPLTPDAILQSIRVAVAKHILQVTVDEAMSVGVGCAEMLPDVDGNEFLQGLADRMVDAADVLHSYTYTGILRVEEIVKTNCAPKPGARPGDVVADVTKNLNEGIGQIFAMVPKKDLKLINVLLASLDETAKRKEGKR